MKHCPQCNRSYADESLRYCLEDGALLVARTVASSYNAQPTLVMPPPAPPQHQPAPMVARVEREASRRRQLWPMLIGVSAFFLAILLVAGWWFSARALLYQTRQDNTGSMKVLLLFGANANVRDESESTPLMGAAWRGQTEAVKILLANGADANSRNKVNETPLILAAKDGHTDIVRLLLDKNPDLNAKDSDGWTCLMWASWGGHLDTVKLLLSTGIKVGSQNNNGETAGTLAAKQGHSDIAELLARENRYP